MDRFVFRLCVVLVTAQLLNALGDEKPQPAKASRTLLDQLLSELPLTRSTASPEGTTGGTRKDEFVEATTIAAEPTKLVELPLEIAKESLKEVLPEDKVLVADKDEKKVVEILKVENSTDSLLDNSTLPEDKDKRMIDEEKLSKLDLEAMKILEVSGHVELVNDTLLANETSFNETTLLANETVLFLNESDATTLQTEAEPKKKSYKEQLAEEKLKREKDQQFLIEQYPSQLEAKKRGKPVDYYRCTNGAYIDSRKVCDGVLDCRDRHNSDESPEICANRTVVCHGNSNRKCPNTNVCVSREQFCDGFNDCGDNYDEDIEACKNNVCPVHAGWFKCRKTERCIPEIWLCDRHHDCGNGKVTDTSDEDAGICTDRPRCGDNPRLFKCKTTQQCVARARICDGHPDCNDHSDEIDQQCGKRTCLPHEFECEANHKYGRYECIPKVWLCDGTPQCVDGADEFHPSCPANHSIDECNHFEHRCISNGQCVAASQVCNGLADCVDGSDEVGCENLPLLCKQGEFRCKGEKRCILKDWLCDGANDCFHGDDEQGCPQLKYNYLYNTPSPTLDVPTTSSPILFKPKARGGPIKLGSGSAAWYG